MVSRSDVFIFTMLLISGNSLAQWSYQASLDHGVSNPGIFVGIEDVLFLSPDTGYFCYTIYGTPGGNDQTVVRMTTNGGANWSYAYGCTYSSTSATMLKFYDPYIYLQYTVNAGVVSKRCLRGLNVWEDCIYPYWMPGSVNDFIKPGPDTYLLLVDQFWFSRSILFEIENNSITRSDTFTSNFPFQLMEFSDSSSILLGTHRIRERKPDSTYTSILSDALRTFKSMGMSDNGFVYVACSGGDVYSLQDSAGNWQVSNTGYNLNLNDLSVINDSVVYLAGDSGLVLMTYDYGNSWIRQAFPSTSKCLKIQFINDTVGFVWYEDKIAITQNGGITWRNEDHFTENSISLFPNPAKDELHISLPDDLILRSSILIEIRDMYGWQVARTHYSNSDILEPMDVSHLDSGMYVLSIDDGKTFMAKKFLITR